MSQQGKQIDTLSGQIIEATRSTRRMLRFLHEREEAGKALKRQALSTAFASLDNKKQPLLAPQFCVLEAALGLNPFLHKIGLPVVPAIDWTPVKRL